MARVSSSQTGPADLPQLVERLHAGGPKAVDDFTQDELETVIDDLPLALESESIRDHLAALVGRIENRLERTFRRIIEIARQDEDRVDLLLSALRELRWRGAPTEDEFAWLVQRMSASTPAARLAAFERAATLSLHEAQAAMLDALGSTSGDDAIRLADKRRRESATPGIDAPAAMTEELVRSHEAERAEEMAPEAGAQDAATDGAFAETDPGAIPPEETGAVPGPWEDPGATAVSALAAEPETPADDIVADVPAGDAVVEDASAPVFDESQAQDETWSQKESSSSFNF